MPRIAQTGTGRKTEPISVKKASQMSFKSTLDGPISQMSLLEKSLFFAEVALISYMTPQECNIAAGKLGFREGKYYDGDAAQACWFQNDNDSVVACRGTEPNDWKDIEADTNALLAVGEAFGRVHRGFKLKVDHLWPALEEALTANTRTIWFTGHSLGGAMATICAGRCLLSHIKSEPAGLFTFGSPRVGDRQFINYTNVPHFRWVNNNDIVARVPPYWFGYRHSGQELYLDRNGRLRKLNGWRRISDRLQGFYRELVTKFRIDPLSDHSIIRYVDGLHALMRDGVVAEHFVNLKNTTNHVASR